MRFCYIFERNHDDSHDYLFDTPNNNRSSFDCSLDGACLAEDSFSEVLLNESAAAEEDTNKRAFTRPLSKLVVAEHSDGETNAFFQTRQKQIPQHLIASLTAQVSQRPLSAKFLSTIPPPQEKTSRSKPLTGPWFCLSFQSTARIAPLTAVLSYT